MLLLTSDLLLESVLALNSAYQAVIPLRQSAAHNKLRHPVDQQSLRRESIQSVLGDEAAGSTLYFAKFLKKNEYRTTLLFSECFLTSSLFLEKAETVAFVSSLLQ